MIDVVASYQLDELHDEVFVRKYALNAMQRDGAGSCELLQDPMVFPTNELS